jgi:hypothetical protein
VTMTEQRGRRSGQTVEESERLVLETLRRLCAETPPMSATGGWYPTQIVALHVGRSVGMVQNHLYNLENRGEIESRQRPHSSGNPQEHRIRRST